MEKKVTNNTIPSLYFYEKDIDRELTTSEKLLLINFIEWYRDWKDEI